MSTLAAARADNFYFSKTYDPEKVKPRKSDLEERKPFTRVEGQHIYGKKIRYETPFHVRCNGCKNMIAKGVRFNAVQKWVGNYFTTEIYEFFMKCPQCPMKIVVRTDPEHCDYKYLEGAYKIFQTSDCTDEDRIRDTAVSEKIAENPFFRLENEHIDKEANEKNLVDVQQLEEKQKRGLMDFELNRQLRGRIKALRKEEKQYNDYRKDKNLTTMAVLEPTEQDDEEANRVKFRTKQIKKQHREPTQRELLKEKLEKLNPNFKRILRKEIQTKNAPISRLSKK